MALMALALALGGGGLPSLAAAQVADAASAAVPTSPDAVDVANWVTASGDNHGLPFIVIDKVAAVVMVFDAQGRLMGAAPALLGEAHGDDSVPGIGDRELSAIRPEQRTTPAGRFVAGFGPATGHHYKVLWVDYASSVALHPVITANRRERRVERLQSPSAQDNRITYGCINISATFYEKVVRTVLSDKGGVVYILPESKPLNEVFPTFRAAEQASLEMQVSQ
jgi:hypothetical protein